MKAQEINLWQYFQPKIYKLNINDNRATLLILGQKVGRPNKRLVLHQKNIKITSAKLIRHGKKGPEDIAIERINHLPTFEQVRIHTKEMQYPGRYELRIIFNITPKQAEQLFSSDKNSHPSRRLMPCIDTPESWASAELEVKS